MNLESGVLQVHVEDIIPNRFQPRLTFDEQGLKELSDSIREHGIIQPLVLRKLGDKYEIIAGERRYKAAQMVGLTTVPAVIANIDDNKSAEVALVENIQRRDLTAIEEARSYKNLLDKGYLTQEQLAKRMGLSQPAIANKLRLLNLDEEVQQALLEERISERHARTLLGVQDKAAQKEWLHRIINERLTVRQLDLELKKLKSINDLSSSNESDENGEVPLASSIPSIEEIKANAMDLSEARNKIVTENVTETLETLEITDNIQAQPISNYGFNNPIENDSTFTTATTIPEFNIATPNSSSTFVAPENLLSQNESSKFFSSEEKNITNIDFANNPIDPSFSTIDDNGLEIFDVPSIDNSFVSDLVTAHSETPAKPELLQSPNENNMNQFNSIDLSPNNKFFTPTQDRMPEIQLPTNLNKEVDPMSAVEKLTPEYKLELQEKGEMELKDAISSIRSCIETLGEKGFFIEVEEIDFDSNYQITLRIHKDN